MIAIQSSTPQKCTPHLLPARLNHNGPVNNTPRYFAPTPDEKGQPHAYFRGRHLHGTSLALPANYTGAVLHVTERNVVQPLRQEEDDDEEEEVDVETEVEVKIAEVVREFEEVVVWGHGGVVPGEGDAFVRGVREWIGFAECMHGEEDEGEDEGDEREGEKKAA